MRPLLLAAIAVSLVTIVGTNGTSADVKGSAAPAKNPDAELKGIADFCTQEFPGTNSEAQKRQKECQKRHTDGLTAWRALVAKGEVHAQFERICASAARRKDDGRNWARFWSCYAMHTGKPASPASQ